MPDRPSILTNLAGSLYNQNKVEEALEFARKALVVEPENAEALLVVACGLTRQGRFSEAVGILERVVTRDPQDPEAWAALGATFARMRRPADAARAYRNALVANPGFEYALGDLVNARMNACDWDGIELDWAALVRGIRDGQPVARPFQILTIPASPADQLACGRLWSAREHPTGEPLWRRERYDHKRIRVAYVCADYRGHHPITQVMLGLFEQHDRARFETIAIATESDDTSPRRERVERAFERYIEAGHMSDREIAELIRSLEVDIAVDLNGYTTNSRSGSFAMRPAPIQVSYIAFPGSMGADFIDYLIADSIVVPPADSQYYSERIVRLPESYYLADDAAAVPVAKLARADHGLPEHGFVFCCFNSGYKITPDVFDVWMRLLTKVAGSVLWLLESNPSVSDNLKKEARARGIVPARLVFAPRADGLDHLARHRHADLFLDTLPYNAHTTATDALWMGLPVLTCVGQTFAGRVSASLLNAIGLPELITTSLEEYELRALELAQQPARLAELKARLGENRRTYPLFSTRRSAQHVEAAYVQMMNRLARGEPPGDFAVAPGE